MNVPAKWPAFPLSRRPYVLSAHTAGGLIEDVWPTIFFGVEVVDEIRRKAAALAWARRAVERMEEEADAALGQPPLLPMEQAGWRHDFFARATGEHLVYDPASPGRFLDPATGSHEGDAAQRRAWVLLTHERTFRMMRGAGFLYRLTGDERYAHWVAQGMRQAAAYFARTEFRRPDTGGAAHYFCNLYDAAMLMLLAGIYGLTRGSGAYSAEDHAAVRARIFADRIPTMVEFLHRRPAHNMSCFVSGALGLAGEVFDRPDWLSLALGTDSGLRTQLMKGVPTGPNGEVDGLWYEGTLFYHFYSLCALIGLWELARRCGDPLARDLDLQRRFAAMLAAPVELVDPQLRLPLVGDLGAPRTMNLAAYRHVYEYAAGQVDPDRFAPLLATLYAQSGAPREGLTALAFGPDQLPEPGGVPRGHTVLPVARLAVFRSPPPRDLYLTFRAGRYAGGHDHPDRLTLALHAFGDLISPDLGEPGYSLRGPGNASYCRSTAAHNTLFADEEEQAGEASLEWRPDATPPCARGLIVDARGLRFRRTIFFDPPHVALLDEYEAESPHRYGWIFHAYGSMAGADVPLAADAGPALGMPPLPATGGLAFFAERRSGVAPGRLDATWRVTDAMSLRLLTASDGPFEVTAAVCPGNPYPDLQGALLLRAPGAARRFATVLEPYRGVPAVADVGLRDGEVVLRLADGTAKQYRWG